MDSKEYYALFCEQGTGKTWMFLADAEREYIRGNINGLLVIAPKGVHTNWIRREIPTHLEVDTITASYHSGATKKQQAAVENLFRPRDTGTMEPLRILAMNIDAIITEKGYECARRFLIGTSAGFILDESYSIKNPQSARTKAIIKLAKLAVFRRIGTGTPIGNAPPDVFMQFEFLESGLLGTTSYRSFFAEYAELLPDDSGLMKHIQRRNPGRFTPQIVATGPDGKKKWRNLDKLHSITAPYAYRVLKKDCLDLPEKIYQNAYFELTPEQRRVYARIEEELRIAVGSEDHTFNALSKLSKLQQVTSGFVHIEGVPMLLEPESNPRLECLMDQIENVEGQFIIWAIYIEEIEQIRAALEKKGITHVAYYGAVKDKDRETAVDDFQCGRARAFVGQPKAGGIGLTLHAAETVYYYSNNFSHVVRQQSEDRAHRIGQHKNVVYVDLCAVDTVDEKIARALQNKEEVAAVVLGDYKNVDLLR
jgi:SNF2 family DNA or RNA helicase